MNNLLKTGLSTSLIGTVASFVTTAALALLARAEGREALQPTRSTSHWLYGEEAGRSRSGNPAETAVGYGTHHASAMFWAAPFEIWLSRNPPRSPPAMLRDASVVAAVAALVDYALVPKRLTPGWENVLSKRSVAVTYGALALGLAAGGLITQELQKRR